MVVVVVVVEVELRLLGGRNNHDDARYKNSRREMIFHNLLKLGCGRTTFEVNHWDAEKLPSWARGVAFGVKTLN